MQIDELDYKMNCAPLQELIKRKTIDLISMLGPIHGPRVGIPFMLGLALHILKGLLETGEPHEKEYLTTKVLELLAERTNDKSRTS